MSVPVQKCFSDELTSPRIALQRLHAPEMQLACRNATTVAGQRLRELMQAKLAVENVIKCTPSPAPGDVSLLAKNCNFPSVSRKECLRKPWKFIPVTESRNFFYVSLKTCSHILLSVGGNEGFLFSPLNISEPTSANFGSGAKSSALKSAMCHE